MISTLHANNKKVICYFSAGSFESWRPDASSFQASDKGAALEGWDNEWWLNTNSANVRTIMKARLDLAKSKGCDAVDPDNVDVYHNANGLGITEAQSIDYLTFLATEAHARGMAMGLKNGVEMVPQLLDIMDFQVNESCMQFNECDRLAPFITAGKPVFHIEYNDNSATKKRQAATDANCSFKGGPGFSTLKGNADEEKKIRVWDRAVKALDALTEIRPEPDQRPGFVGGRRIEHPLFSRFREYETGRAPEAFESVEEIQTYINKEVTRTR
ncbi:hypothetical protein M7I_1533 [Glarea lozoyensis 74030]|uniref:alpha-galactosidase n=1 Tax=Glarea lozoyensis (strain ATCC 74030 / MF5533) TaxID=1104152 RepID=H0EGB8_GLAL7|nr:hypothetical protein M7I_1533 [Glarea lozoyensis 74030]